MNAARYICVLVISFAATSLSGAQPATPIPTLVVPTLVAPQAEEEPPRHLPVRSATADIIDLGAFRVGVLYNEPPFSEYTLQGDLRGIDIDLLRLIVELWGTDVDFIQVTRANALDRLNSGELHAIASAFVHYRDLDHQLEFSQTYLFSRLAMMVRSDSPYQSLTELSSQRVGYVIGTRSEKALNSWNARLNANLDLKFYLTLDRAFAALTAGEIEGLVGEEHDLLRVALDFYDRVRILDQALVREPRAFAIRRHDIKLRHLLNHSIQLLAFDGSLFNLYRKYFPDSEILEEAVTLWDGIGETINPTQYAGELTHPTSFALPRILQSGALRVGGIAEEGQSASASQAQLAALNLTLVQELARLWSVSVEIVSSNADEAIDLLARGAVDMVAGVKPDWRRANVMDFSAPYLLHGDRLMVPANSQIGGFNDLRGRIIGLILGDEGARDRAQAWADSINASVRFFQTGESGAALQLLEFNNANAIYADSLLLAPHLQANAGVLRLTDRWYSHSYFAFGLPYNDLELRLLVNYTIQELARDGTLARLSGALILSDELPDFEITPGASQFVSFNLAGA